MKDLVIRRAAADEISACAALYARVQAETFAWVRPDRLPTAEDFIAEAADETVYLAATETRLYGVAAFHAPTNFLHALFVAERGLGVGKRLLDRVLADADGPVTLKVDAANLRAEAFYLREGFRVLSRGSDPPSGLPWIKMVR
jgi:GNAT superfamily N-acetyltransferase